MMQVGLGRRVLPLLILQIFTLAAACTSRNVLVPSDLVEICPLKALVDRYPECAEYLEHPACFNCAGYKNVKLRRFLCCGCLTRLINSQEYLFFPSPALVASSCYANAVKYIVDRAINASSSRLVFDLIDSIVRKGAVETFVFSLNLSQNDLKVFLDFLEQYSEPGKFNNMRILVRTISDIQSNWNADQKPKDSRKDRVNANTLRRVSFYKSALKYLEKDEGRTLPEGKQSAIAWQLSSIYEIVKAELASNGSVVDSAKELVCSMIIQILCRVAEADMREIKSILKKTMTRVDDFTHPALNYITNCLFMNQEPGEPVKYRELAVEWEFANKILFSSPFKFGICDRYVASKTVPDNEIDEKSPLHDMSRRMNDKDGVLTFDFNSLTDWMAKIIESMSAAKAAQATSNLIAAANYLYNIHATNNLTALANFHEIAGKFAFFGELRSRITAQIARILESIPQSIAIKRVRVNQLINREYIYDCIVASESPINAQLKYYRFINLLSNSEDGIVSTVVLYKMFDLGFAGPDEKKHFVANFKSKVNDSQVKPTFYFVYLRGYAMYIHRKYKEFGSLEGLERHISDYKEFFALFSVRIEELWNQSRLYIGTCHLYGLNHLLRGILIKKGLIKHDDCVLPKPEFSLYIDICEFLIDYIKCNKYSWVKETFKDALDVVIAEAFEVGHSAVHLFKNNFERGCKGLSGLPLTNELKEMRSRKNCFMTLVLAVNGYFIGNDMPLEVIFKKYLKSEEMLLGSLLNSFLRSLCFIRANVKKTVPASAQSKTKTKRAEGTVPFNGQEPDVDKHQHHQNSRSAVGNIVQKYMEKIHDEAVVREGMVTTVASADASKRSAKVAKTATETERRNIRKIFLDFIEELTEVDFNEGLTCFDSKVCRASIYFLVKMVLIFLHGYSPTPNYRNLELGTRDHNVKWARKTPGVSSNASANTDEIAPLKCLQTIQRILSKEEVQRGKIIESK